MKPSRILRRDNGKRVKDLKGGWKYSRFYLGEGKMEEFPKKESKTHPIVILSRLPAKGEGTGGELIVETAAAIRTWRVGERN